MSERHTEIIRTSPEHAANHRPNHPHYVGGTAERVLMAVDYWAKGTHCHQPCPICPPLNPLPLACLSPCPSALCSVHFPPSCLSSAQLPSPREHGLSLETSRHIENCSVVRGASSSFSYFAADSVAGHARCLAEFLRQCL